MKIWALGKVKPMRLCRSSGIVKVRNLRQTMSCSTATLGPVVEMVDT